MQLVANMKLLWLHPRLYINQTQKVKTLVRASTMPVDSSIFATNDIGLAVGMALNDEDKFKFLTFGSY